MTTPGRPSSAPALTGSRAKADKLKKALAKPGAVNDPVARAAGARKLCAALDAGQLTPFEAAGALHMAGGLSIEEAVKLVRTATATTCPRHKLGG